MTARTVICLCLGLASLAAAQKPTDDGLPRIPNPEDLAIEMANALVAGDRDRFTALAATREEMERLLETAYPSSRPEDRQYEKDKVAEILADRRGDFDRFQAMKKRAGVKEGVPVRFELISLDSIYVKDGMKKIRHSRVRLLQGSEGGTTEFFIISLDDMFLFPRGWAFTSVRPGIGHGVTSAASLAQPGGGLVVQVTRNGAPVANARVCVGVTGDLNQHFQGQTGTDGRVRFNAVPSGAFVVTAHSGTRGAQQSFSPATPGTIPVMNVAVTLPAAGGPSCPTTPAGPSRPLIPKIDRSQVPQFEPITRPGSTLDLRQPHVCFGALGMECGQPQGAIPAVALCSGGRCFINGGSWDHDECCVANPQGMACRRGPLDSLTGHDGNCVTSWNKAVRLARRGLFWERQVDFSRQNRTGQVEFALYCAPANALLPPEDAAKCCSGATRALTFTENAAAQAAGENLRACQ